MLITVPGSDWLGLIVVAVCTYVTMAIVGYDSRVCMCGGGGTVPRADVLDCHSQNIHNHN